MQYTFLYCQAHLRFFRKQWVLPKNLEVMHIVWGEGRGSSYLFHYDVLLMKINVAHPLYFKTFVTIEKIEPCIYD